MSENLAESLTGILAERILHDYVKSAVVDEVVLSKLLPNNEPLEYEGSIWDYKRSLPDTSGRNSKDPDNYSDLEISELVKDVVSFHNSFGGYILSGVEDNSDKPLIGCRSASERTFDIDKFNEKVRKYTRTEIRCRFRRLRVPTKFGEIILGLLHIPMRDPECPVVQMARGAPEKKGGSAFQKDDIFARMDDSCVPARADSRVLPFVCSNRIFDKSQKEAFELAENNLPPRDPNLVEFVGRTEYLGALWKWIVERHSPVKVLTALGGTGKTAIAYEFSRQIVGSPPAWLYKVVWLSAKKQIFSAIQGKMHSASRVDFHDVPSFFASLCRELGVFETDIKECGDDLDDLIDITLKSLNTFPSFVIIDDIDTLPLDQQNDLFSLIQTLAGRTFDNGTRILVTSRLDFGAASQRIEVSGFPQKEFSAYVKILSNQTGIEVTKQSIEQLRKSSLGSPVFAASVFRLVSLGAEFHTAIREWKGRAGEDVRRFAFEREIDQLTQSQARTLYALATLRETTQVELAQILEVDEQKLIADLSRLREYHLFATDDVIGSGSKLVVPAPIAMMQDVIEKKISDPRRIEKECAKARSQSPNVNDSISAALGQIIALWKEDSFDDALLVAQSASQKNPRSSDLQCMLGRSFLKVRPPRATDAEKAFAKAMLNECTRPELVPLWIEAKRQLQDWVGIAEVAEKAPRSDIRGATAYLVVLAEANLGLQAMQRGDIRKAVGRFKGAMTGANQAIRDGRAGDSLPELRELCRESARRYVSLVEQRSPMTGDKVNVFNAVYDAFKCHISETRLMLTGGSALKEWARDVVRRRPKDAEALSILNRRLGDLNSIVEQIRSEEFDRSSLFLALEKIYDDVSDDLELTMRSYNV